MPGEDPNTKPEDKQEQPAAADLYLQELNNLKANSVKKEDYDKVVEERNKLIKAAAERTFSPEGEEDEAAKLAKESEASKARRQRIDELGKKFRNTDGNITNLEYIQDALELRKLVLEESKGQNDLFVNPNASPTNESYEHAARTADVLQQCVDFAKGDPRVFTTVLQTRIKDDNIRPGNTFNRRA